MACSASHGLATPTVAFLPKPRTPPRSILGRPRRTRRRKICLERRRPRSLPRSWNCCWMGRHFLVPPPRCYRIGSFIGRARVNDLGPIFAHAQVEKRGEASWRLFLAHGCGWTLKKSRERLRDQRERRERARLDLYLAATGLAESGVGRPARDHDEGRDSRRRLRMLGLHRLKLLSPRPLYILPPRHPALLFARSCSHSHPHHHPHRPMATPVTSSQQPAQIPALDAAHKDAPAPSKKKDKKAKDAGSSHPLEVRKPVRSSPPASARRLTGEGAAQTAAGVLRPPHQNLRQTQGRV